MRIRAGPRCRAEPALDIVHKQAVNRHNTREHWRFARLRVERLHAKDRYVPPWLTSPTLLAAVSTRSGPQQGYRECRCPLDAISAPLRAPDERDASDRHGRRPDL